ASVAVFPERDPRDGYFVHAASLRPNVGFSNTNNVFEPVSSSTSDREGRGPAGGWQRYEEATMRQRRPANPTDPGDAADLSIMGCSNRRHGSFVIRSDACFDGTTLCKRELGNQYFLNQRSRIAWIKVNFQSSGLDLVFALPAASGGPGDNAVAAAALGLVERHVGALQQFRYRIH